MIRHTVKAHKLALRLGVASLLACSTLALSSASMADAEPALSFRPAKAWSVNAEAIGVSSAQVQNCSISSEFNNGFILGLNGSHKWVQSLNLDLRQAALEKGNMYDIALSVPGVSKINAPAVASKDNLLVVDMKGQKSLYQAMRDSAVLDVKIEDNEFRFYLSNFAPAAKQFERCMAGGDIKAITSDEPLQASASEDPFARFTANESIALEEQEARTAAITEIDPAEPKPVAQRIPYKETEKVGNAVVGQKNVDPNAPKKASEKAVEDITELEIEAPAAVAVKAPEVEAESISADKRTLAENAVENARPEPRKRMTEMLAQEIQDNPDIASIEEEVAASELPSIEETTPVVIKEAAPKPAPAPVIEEAALEAPKKPAPVQKEPKMAKELIIPPVIDDIPLDATAATEPESIAALPEPEAAPQEESPAVTAEDLNRQQLEKIAARKSRSEGWKQTAEAKKNVEGSSQTPEDISMTAETPEESLEPVVAAQDITEDEPFSQALEKVTGLSDPSLKDDIVVETTPVAEKKTTPPAPELSTAALPEDDILLPVQDVAEVEAVRVSTPDVIKSRETSRGEADFTNLDAMEPASSNSSGTYRDPEFGRKVSQLERMINDLEKENSALKSELEAALEEMKQERVSVSSDNWNLERATMKFNEAERQVKTLGQQLQRERTQCEMEKKELETMLFDPQVTDQAQLARLADLERKLMSCKSGG